jgi:hypothetical protein
MDRLFPRAALAAILGLGVLAGLARAQAVRVLESSSAPVVVSDAVPTEVAGAWSEGQIAGPDGAAHPKVHFPRTRGWLMKCGLTCSTSHDSPGCGSLKSECTFIFGSCHAFYSEPCFAGPPPTPSELYYSAQGYRPPPRAGGGCGCR